MSKGRSEREIKDSLRDFIKDNFLFSEEIVPFSDDDSFLENRIIDSTGILELIEYVEEYYQLSIEDSELLPENLDSVNKVCSFVLRKKKDKVFEAISVKVEE